MGLFSIRVQERPRKTQLVSPPLLTVKQECYGMPGRHYRFQNCPIERVQARASLAYRQRRPILCPSVCDLPAALLFPPVEKKDGATTCLRQSQTKLA
jgi:hypothetical protein